jgi:toxin ParE1/3/4
MAFRVELTKTSLANLESIYESIHAESSEQAFRWFNGLERAILSLRENSDGGSRAPENGAFRQLLYGRKPNFYRISIRCITKKALSECITSATVPGPH